MATINKSVRAAYDKLRADNHPAAYALRVAKKSAELEPGYLDWDGTSGETFERDGFTIRIDVEYDDRYIKELADEDQNFGYFGDSRQHPYSIKVAESDSDHGEWYNPNPATVHMPDRFAAGERAKGLCRHDLDQYYRRVERSAFGRHLGWLNDDWSYIGIVVTVSSNDVRLATASLWGIESDFGDYGREVATELADEAIDEAQDSLKTLCALHGPTLHS